MWYNPYRCCGGNFYPWMYNPWFYNNWGFRPYNNFWFNPWRGRAGFYY